MIRVINVQNFDAALKGAVEFCIRNQGQQIDIVVPDKLSLFMEKYLFTQLGISASFNINVSTLNRFAKRNLCVDKEKVISKSGCVVLVHKILNEHFEEFSILKSGAYSFNYAEEIFKTISQLKSSKIYPDEMKVFHSQNKQLEAKIQDLAKIYEFYETEKAGMLDVSDLFLMSALFVAEGRENHKIIFVGFDDFTAIEYSIIERLATVCEVSVENYASKASNKHIYCGDVFTSLKQIALVNELKFEVDDFDYKASNLKSFLADNLFGTNNSTFCLDKEPVKIFAVGSVTSEIEFVARDIRKKIIAGEKFENFAVAVFSLENIEKKIKEIFAKYELNYYLDSQIAINKTIFYKFLQSVFKFNLEGYPLVHLIDIINSPFFELEEELKRKLIQKLIDLNFRGKEMKFDLGEELKDAKNKLLEFINLFVLEKSADIADIIAMILEADKTIHFDSILERVSSGEFPLIEKLTLTKSKEQISVLFDDIKKFYKNASLETVFDIFSHIGDNLKFNNLPLTLDAVKIVDANNCLEQFENLYIVNCTADNAPTLKYDCGVILDDEIEQLNFANKLSPTIAHINRLSLLRLYNFTSMFNSSLAISYSLSPSSLIKELIKRLQVGTDLGKLNLVPITEHKDDISLSKWDYISSNCKNFKKGENNFINSTYLDEKIIKNKNFFNISEKNLKIYNNLQTISASQLESYFKCPFASFLQNTMKIKPRLESEILSLDVGNILHEILFNYFKAKKQVGDIYEFCLNQVYSFIEKDPRLKLNAKSPIITALIDEAVRVINGVDYIDQNSSFKPQLFEFEFRDKTALNLGNINLVGKVDRVDESSAGLRIVDYKSGHADATLKELFYGNKLQLFLYALAMENVSKKRVVGGFYLPLHNAYTRELTNSYSLKGFFENETDVVQALDNRLTPGTKSDIVNVRMNKDMLASKTIGYKELSPQDYESLKTYAKLVSAGAVEEIKSGYILPTPTGVSKPCEYCPYKQICLKDCNGVKFREPEKITPASFKRGEDEK